MSLLQMLVGGMAGTKTYVDDVFSAYTYTGNGATQTITNGIDLSGQGGMVWLKSRSNATDNYLIDTERGRFAGLVSNKTDAANGDGLGGGSFLSNGFSVTQNIASINVSTNTYASWTFRKAPKFFDVQTATLSSGNATVSFANLATLGMVIVKRTDSTGSWYVWHRSLTAGKLLYLEQTAAEATLGHITVSGTTLTLVDGTLADGDYVCYGFAHDTSADGIIQCGSFTTDGSGIGSATLNWEPQLVLLKTSSTTVDWQMIDSMRGFTAAPNASNQILNPNLSIAEFNQAGGIYPTATGFASVNAGLSGGQTYIYLAIRRPNKPPTLGTQVYNAIARTGTGAAATVTGIGFAPDLVLTRERLGNVLAQYTADRLRGSSLFLSTNKTDADSVTTTDVTAFGMDGVNLGASPTLLSNGAYTYINWFFRRAPGVFDQVCYTGTGSVGHNIPHNLGVIPELIIVKDRTSANSGLVYASAGGGGVFLRLFAAATSDYGFTTSANPWNNTTPTSAQFTVDGLGGYIYVNSNGDNYVAYLFATKAGISKVGSYTGNGSSQTINCGFTTGARFVLIKRTDSTGDWFVWDSVRGIVAGDDPHLSLNTTAAEVTTDDSIDPDTSGFIVNQVAATNINVTSATYIFLSFA